MTFLCKSNLNFNPIVGFVAHGGRGISKTLSSFLSRALSCAFSVIIMQACNKMFSTLTSCNLLHGRVNKCMQKKFVLAKSAKMPFFVGRILMRIGVMSLSNGVICIRYERRRDLSWRNNLILRRDNDMQKDVRDYRILIFSKSKNSQFQKIHLRCEKTYLRVGIILWWLRCLYE